MSSRYDPEQIPTLLVRGDRKPLTPAEILKNKKAVKAERDIIRAAMMMHHQFEGSKQEVEASPATQCKAPCWRKTAQKSAAREFYSSSGRRSPGLCQGMYTACEILYGSRTKWSRMSTWWCI